MVAVLAPVAGVALGSAIGDVRGCTTNVDLTVSASPEIAPVLDGYARKWSDNAQPSQGMCVNVKVSSVDSASVAAAFARAEDFDLDLAGADTETVKLPDVWVPESMTWMSRLGGDLDGTFDERLDSVAESSVGLAVDESDPQAEAGALFSDTPVSLSDPHSDAAALTLLLTADAKSGPTVSYDKAGPQVMSKAAVQAYNKENPDKKLTYIDPSPALQPFDYPYVTRSEAPDEKKDAATIFRSALVKNSFVEELAANGMRAAGPYPSAPETDDVDKVLKEWDES